MKTAKKILSLTLCVGLLLCGITFTARAESRFLSVEKLKTVAGNSGRIAITAGNFEGFVGGFGFEIRFPEIVEITDLYLGDKKLTPYSSGGTDYKIAADNTLVISDTCNYGGDTALGDRTVYYAEFIVSDDASPADYPVVITENSYLVSDDDDTRLIPLNKINGVIRISESAELRGDVDKSGKIDAADLIALKKILLNGDYGDVFKGDAADLCADGALDIRDLIELKKYTTRSVVYLSDNGDDRNTGDSREAPVATLNRAVDRVYDGGTVYITDTYTVDNAFRWNKHGKQITVSGGKFDASAVTDFNIGDNTVFSGLTLNFRNSQYIYANGFSLKISEDVTVNGSRLVLCGGGTYETEKTNLEIYAGSYRRIYGGGYCADVAGNVRVTVGGSVNADLNEADHNGGVCIHGGGFESTVSGNIYLTVNGNAKATYVYGGGEGVSSQVSGKINVRVGGGAFMGAYAGCAGGSCSDTEFTLSGGKFEQIFGGSSDASIKGNARINILGGTVTRRIYGGCYNELTMGGSWLSQYHVSGDTTLFLSAGADVKFGSFNDYGIFACSRYESHFADENSTVIFENLEAEYKFGGLLGQQDGLSLWISDWPAAAKKVTTQNTTKALPQTGGVTTTQVGKAEAQAELFAKRIDEAGDTVAVTGAITSYWKTPPEGYSEVDNIYC